MAFLGGQARPVAVILRQVHLLNRPVAGLGLLVVLVRLVVPAVVEGARKVEVRGEGEG